MILHRVFSISHGKRLRGLPRSLPASLGAAHRARGAEGTEREPEPGARVPGRARQPAPVARARRYRPGLGKREWGEKRVDRPGKRSPRQQLQEENNEEAEPPSPRRPPPQAPSRAAFKPARSEAAGGPGWLSRSRPAARQLPSPAGGFGAPGRLSPRASRPQGAVRRGARGGRAGRARRPGPGLCTLCPRPPRRRPRPPSRRNPAHSGGSARTDTPAAAAPVAERPCHVPPPPWANPPRPPSPALDPPRPALPPTRGRRKETDTDHLSPAPLTARGQEV